MLSYEQLTLRIALAAFFGAIIGLERERKNWTAGMRTHMMVSVGSCLFMIVSAFGFSDILGTRNVELDPSRVAAQVVSGIGFIGAGTILFLRRGAIKGLTTAAGLWTVAAIGLATGGGMYFAAGITTVLALGILWAMQPLERFLTKKFKQRTLNIITKPNVDANKILKELWGLKPGSFYSLSLDKHSNAYSIQLIFEELNFNELEKTIDELSNNPDVKEIHWSR